MKYKEALNVIEEKVNRERVKKRRQDEESRRRKKKKERK